METGPSSTAERVVNSSIYRHQRIHCKDLSQKLRFLGMETACWKLELFLSQENPAERKTSPSSAAPLGPALMFMFFALDFGTSWMWAALFFFRGADLASSQMNTDKSHPHPAGEPWVAFGTSPWRPISVLKAQRFLLLFLLLVVLSWVWFFSFSPRISGFKWKLLLPPPC